MKKSEIKKIAKKAVEEYLALKNKPVHNEAFEKTLHLLKNYHSLSSELGTTMDTALELLMNKCKLSNQMEKFNIIYMLYIDPQLQQSSFSQKKLIITDYIICSESSLFRWRNELVEQLSIFIFGCEALGLEDVACPDLIDWLE